MPVNKHIPLRTCVACGKIKPQRDMIRLVCAGDTKVEIDIKGKKSGRGAYVCRLPECQTNVLTGNRLEHALRIGLSREYREQLANDLKEVCGGKGR